MKTIKLTAVRQINYPFHTPECSCCCLVMYLGSGVVDEAPFRRSVTALIYPGQSLTIMPGNEPGNAMLLSFEPDILPRAMSGTARNRPTVLHDPSDSFRDFFASGWTLLEAMPDEKAAFHTVSALLSWLAMYLPETRQENPGSSSRLLVEQAKTIIHNEYASDLTLQTVAAQLFVNPSYLSTVFHQVSGMTFRSYLKTVRLQHTCRLLTQTNHLITDIAMQTGFNSTAYLISSFRKEYGMTPNAYRALHSGR